MITFLHTPPNEHPIDEVYVVMSVDENGHGICASTIPGIGAALLVTGSTSPVVIQAFKNEARQIAKSTGRTIGLFRFKREQTIWLCDPSGLETQ